MHQLRIVVDNQYNPEAQNDEGISPFEVSHETFMKLVRPAVGYIANADAMAILKRAAFIVFTEKYIYFRPPSEKALPVKFLLWPNPPCKDILVADCKPTLSNWKQGGPPPANYAEMVAWECEWLKELFRRHDEKSRPHACPPARASTTPLLDALLTADGCPPAAPSHASLALASSSSHPVFPAVVPGIMKVEAEEYKDGHAWLARETADDPVDVDTDRASAGWSVKQEKAPVFRSLPFQATGIIELDTPSPPRKKRALAPPNPDSLPGLQNASDSEDDPMPPVGCAPEDSIGGSGSQGGFKDVCLVLALQSLGLPVACDRDGPLSISYGNSLLLPYGLQLFQRTSRTTLPDGSYVVFDKALHHFFAIQTHEGFIVKKDGGQTTVMSFGGIMDMLRSDNYTFYSIRKQNQLSTVSFNAVGGSSPITYSCPLDTCVCPGCSGSLTYHISVDAILYDLNGPVEIVHEQKNCTSRSCRASYGYNYRWAEGQKINVLGTADFADGVIFVNAKKAFSIKYLQYHEELLCRGHLSSTAISHAYHTVHSDSGLHIVADFKKLHASALFYFMAVREFEPLGLHTEIIIEDEVQNQHLDLYDAYCHSSIFPPHDRRKVTTMVIDGNQKMKMQCAEAPSKRAGRPRKSEKTVGNYTNGWMLGCDPKSGRILSLQPMHEPENNDVAHAALTHVLWLYPKLDCLVYDRACSFKAFGIASGNLDQVKFYISDGFHAHGHSRSCPCNPRNSCFARNIFMCLVSLFFARYYIL